MRMAQTYLDSDAWVLLAIITAAHDGPITLEYVIGAADWINHAILLWEEMEGALARLTAAGHVIHRDGKFSPGPEALAFYNGTKRRGRKVLEAWDDMRTFLGISGRGYDEKPLEANRGVSYPLLTLAEFEEGIEKYKMWHPRLYAAEKKEAAAIKAAEEKKAAGEKPKQ